VRLRYPVWTILAVAVAGAAGSLIGAYITTAIRVRMDPDPRAVGDVQWH